jgi:hypothetical protein
MLTPEEVSWCTLQYLNKTNIMAGKKRRIDPAKDPGKGGNPHWS